VADLAGAVCCTGQPTASEGVAMNLNRLIRTALSTLVTTGAMTAMLAAPAAAAPSDTAAASDCTLIITKVENRDLQEPPRDEIYLIVGDETSRNVWFEEFDVKQGYEFGDEVVVEAIPAGGSVLVQVWEDDWPSKDDLIGRFYAYCTSTPGYVELTGSLGTYRVHYTIA
jgi:hypothetical protein